VSCYRFLPICLLLTATTLWYFINPNQGLAQTTPVPLPSGYVKCAEQRKILTHNCPSGMIAYGAEDRYILKRLTAPFVCNNTTFGNPIGRTRKACYAPSSTSTGETLKLMWNANPEPDLAGYRVYQATASGAYSTPLATLDKTTTSYTVTGLQNRTTYFFVVTAYDEAGNESAFSNEVSQSIF
jgi:hypothetical protein